MSDPGRVAGAYALDVAPGTVDAAAADLRRLRDELSRVAEEADQARTGLDGAWTGLAANAVIGEAAGLTRQTRGVCECVEAAATALGRLAQAWRDARADAAKLAGLDDEAVGAHDDAVRRADRARDRDRAAADGLGPGAARLARDDAEAAHGRAVASAADGLAGTRVALARRMDDVRARAARAADTASRDLADAAPKVTADGTTYSVEPGSLAADLPLTRARLAFLAAGAPADYRDPEFWLPNPLGLVDPFADEFGVGPLGLSQSMLQSYGRGVPLYLPTGRTVTTPAVARVPGIGTYNVALLDREFSLAASGRGLRTAPVNPPTWMKTGGRALGWAGAGLTVFSAGRSQWEQDAARYPDMGDAERVARSAGNAALVGGAAAGGAWVMAGYGATWGAAACAATGVGVTVAWACGAVGGLVGGFIGSKAGAAAGEWVKDWGGKAWDGIGGWFD